MKNFRKAALAIATASSVALAGTSVASADQFNQTGPKKDEQAFSKILDYETPVIGKDVLGSTQTNGQPGWIVLTKVLSFGAIAGAIAGLGIAIGNYLKNQGIIK
ncbi:hypothetical protein [Corynebacterium macclintockiae]|uniref:hypothetical protein n=1 Tax=Corynebacterium macclintockiae TaxID=2913501 RepID=UPI000558ED33|nr:hypothetical protein [Corynebacterium macclintockiae]MDK8870218.1 hypothetical protein [Corynebacterium macclintockiae]